MFGLKFLPLSSGKFPNTKNMIFIFSDEGRNNANRNSGSVEVKFFTPFRRISKY
jgi:hypothetical protein